MNNGQRKAIRDHVKSLIGVVVGAEKFTFKKAKLETGTPAICIYLEQGDQEGLEDNAILTIRVMAPDEVDVDDLLDGFGDSVQRLIEEASVSAAPYQYLTEQGFEYDRDSTEAWTALDIRYEVNY